MVPEGTTTMGIVGGGKGVAVGLWVGEGVTASFDVCLDLIRKNPKITPASIRIMATTAIMGRNFREGAESGS